MFSQHPNSGVQQTEPNDSSGIVAQIQETNFDKICRLAREQNKDALRKLIDTGVCVNIRSGIDTPVCFLAREGNILAVNFLMHNFAANPSQAVIGYAFAGLTDKVDELIVQYGAAIEYAIEGYAHAGRIDLVNHYMKTMNVELKFKILLQAIIGYALGGRGDLVKQELGRLNDIPSLDGKQKVSLVHAAIRACAFAGLTNQLNQWLHTGPALLEAIRGYAHSGRVAQVNHLLLAYHQALTQAQIPPTGKEWRFGKEQAIWAYATNHHEEPIKQLLLEGVDPHQALQGYAVGGHSQPYDELSEYTVFMHALDKEERKKFGRGVNSLAARSFASEYHIDKINQMIERGVDCTAAVMGFEEGGFLSNEQRLLFLLPFIDDFGLRSSICDRAKQLHPSLDRTALLKKTTMINGLMRRYNIDYLSAKALLKKNVPFFLLEGMGMGMGMGLFNNALPTLPTEVIVHIGTFLTGLPNNETETLLGKLNDKLLGATIEPIFKKFKDGLFTNASEYLVEHNAAMTRYLKRMKYEVPAYLDSTTSNDNSKDSKGKRKEQPDTSERPHKLQKN